MSVDLIIASTTSAVRVGTVDNEHLLPAVGNDPFDMTNPGTLVTTMELYAATASSPHSPDHPIFLLTQRSPPITGHQSLFAASVVQWAKDQGVQRILLLTGLDASLRKDRQLLGPLTTRFLSGGDLGPLGPPSKGLESLEIEYREEEEASHGLLPPWVNIRAMEAAPLSYLTIGAFAIEGDNVATAVEVAKQAMKIVGLGNASADIKMPCSFSSVYGRSMGIQFIA